MRKGLFFLVCTLLLSMLWCCKSNSESSTKAPVNNAQSQLNITKKQFLEEFTDQDFKLLDVRTPEEYQQGSIPEAINIDYRAQNFKDQLSKLDKSATYVVYCRSGNRSSKACKLMSELGFSSFYNLEDGYLAWE